MGSAYISQDAGAFYVNANVTWDSNGYVTVSVIGMQCTSWYITGTASGGDRETQYTGIFYDATSTSFQGTIGHSYMLNMIYGSTRIANASGKFTVTADSGGDSGKSYIRINEGEGTSLSVFKAYKGGDLSEWEPAYDGDEITSGYYLKVTSEALDGYDLNYYDHVSSGKQFGFNITWGYNDTLDAFYFDGVYLSGDVTITSTANLKQYTLFINADEGSTISVERISTKDNNASMGELSNGDTIYHFDQLKITFEAELYHRIIEQLVNDVSFTSGNTYIVTGNTNVQTDAIWMGIIQISNGDTVEKYLIYIDNGSEWELFMPYIDNGSSWDLYS